MYAVTGDLVARLLALGKGDGAGLPLREAFALGDAQSEGCAP